MSDKKKSPINPPSDSDPDVVKAKAKVNPQNVGAVLADADALKATDPKSDEATAEQKTAAEDASVDEYMRERAPLDDRATGKPLRGGVDATGDEDENDTNN